jgi:hypothetical protein
MEVTTLGHIHGDMMGMGFLVDIEWYNGGMGHYWGITNVQWDTMIQQI